MKNKNGRAAGDRTYETEERGRQMAAPVDGLAAVFGGSFGDGRPMTAPAEADLAAVVSSRYGNGTSWAPSPTSASGAGVPAVGGIAEAVAEPVKVIGKEQLERARLTLNKYKAGKANFDRRCIENEQWWKLRSENYVREKGTTALNTKSAWLVNVILSKHADAMDAYPEASFLPREAGDKPEAEILSAIVPVLLQQCEYEETWGTSWWGKLKRGVAITGVFWDKSKLGGLGDVAITDVNPLQIFWEPGLKDIQRSRNVFHVELVDNETLEEEYPQLAGKLGSQDVSVNKFIFDDSVDTSDKSPVIDWYYKKHAGGRTVLHYVKFVNDEVLYATEDDPALAGRGLYDHGLYPFVFDPLFPEEGTPGGFGYIDICKDPQRQIDLMNTAIVANCLAAATPRWLKRGDDGINEEEYADWTKPFVHVQGSVDDNVLKPIQVNQLTGNYLSILINKVDEMKETSGNRDVNNGGAPTGVTAASAIAAMQEQSGKLSRDQIQGSYRAFRRIVYTVIELIRQFYDVPRQFRIVGQEGMQAFVAYDNAGLAPQMQQPVAGQDVGMRLPVFDIEVTSSRQSSYSKISQNELALQFYQLGFFNPQMADSALATLEMMDFKGKSEVEKRIAQNGGLFAQMQQIIEMQAAMLGMPAPGQEAAQGQAAPSGGGAKVRQPEAADALGGVQKKNTIVEKAKENANAATQPK